MFIVQAFQTDPCGVEASRGRSRSTRRTKFQTDPCRVEACSAEPQFGAIEGFRRTLVGSKANHDAMMEWVKQVSDPCGVEVSTTPTTELLEWRPQYRARNDRGSLPSMFRTEPGKRFSYVPEHRCDLPVFGGIYRIFRELNGLSKSALAAGRDTSRRRGSRR